MGAKKSTVCTSATSSDSTKIPASSKVSRPTMRRGSVRCGSAASARDRSPGPNLAAQPAQRANAVSRKSSSRVGFTVMGPWLEESIRSLGAAWQRGDGVNLDQHAARKGRDLHGRARGTRHTKGARVNLIHARKVVHVVKVNGGLHNIRPGRAGCIENGLQIREHPLGLRDNIAS